MSVGSTEVQRRTQGKPYHGKAIDPWGFSVWDRLKRTGKVSPCPLAQLLFEQRCCGPRLPRLMSGSATRTWVRLGAGLQ